MLLPSRRRRRRGLAGLLCASVLGSLAVLAAPSAAAQPAELPPQEPGVTLRTYDMRSPLSAICALKPGQTPNVDKLMPVIDWTTGADFRLENNFITHAIGNLPMLSTLAGLVPNVSRTTSSPSRTMM